MSAENLTALDPSSPTPGTGDGSAGEGRGGKAGDKLLLRMAVTRALISLHAPSLFPFGGLDQLDLDLPSFLPGQTEGSWGIFCGS